MNNRILLLLSSLSGALAVGLGAFGAHALKPLIEESALETWRTASFYHFIHTVVVLILSYRFQMTKQSKVTFWIFLTGMMLFSGSLYLISTSNLHGFPGNLLGPITPIGGLFLIIGWLSLSYEAIARKHTKTS